MFTSTSLKTTLFVSLALAASAALPPWVQQEHEEQRIRDSPHMKELIGDNPNFGISKIECVPRASEIAAIDGYTIMNQYTVSAKTHGEGCWMTQQGYIVRDFTVLAVASKKPLGLAGPINFGLLFQDMYVEDPAAGQSGYVNASRKRKAGPMLPTDVHADLDTARRLLADARAHGRDAVETLKTAAQPASLPEPTPVRPNKEGVIVLQQIGEVGYTSERCMAGLQRADPVLGADVLPFRSADASVVACELADATPHGFCGGKLYQHKFTARNFGRTTVTNGPVTYTVQVGYLDEKY